MILLLLLEIQRLARLLALKELHCSFDLIFFQTIPKPLSIFPLYHLILIWTVIQTQTILLLNQIQTPKPLSKTYLKHPLNLHHQHRFLATESSLLLGTFIRTTPLERKFTKYTKQHPLPHDKTSTTILQTSHIHNGYRNKIFRLLGSRLRPRPR